MGDTSTATDELRSRTMRAVKSRDTGPERRVAAMLREHDVRFRRNVVALPGKPDFVIAHRREPGVAIFVHGCWWHAHPCRRGARVPKTNRDYWLAKIDRNRRRDRRVADELRSLGWSVWTLWECRLSQGLPPRLLTRLEQWEARQWEASKPTRSAPRPGE